MMHLKWLISGHSILHDGSGLNKGRRLSDRAPMIQHKTGHMSRIVVLVGVGGQAWKFKKCIESHKVSLVIVTAWMFVSLCVQMVMIYSSESVMTQLSFTVSHKTSVLISASTAPGPGAGPIWFNITSVRSHNIFLTGLSPCVAFALLFLFISYKPHFTSA